MDHINLFQTNAEFLSAYNGSDYVEPWLSYTMETSGISFNKKQTPPPYLSIPLTIEIVDGSGSITLNRNNIKYKLNDEDWVEESSPTISVSNGDKIQLKENHETAYASGAYIPLITDSDDFNDFKYMIYGNIMSVYQETGFEDLTTFTNEETYVFANLFGGCSCLVSAENLTLPATELTEFCYEYMFQGCSSLATTPELPATTLADYCYENMFQDCTSLTTAPELPVTTLAQGCYTGIFKGCTSLTTAPALPATTLAYGCYGGMFNGCTSLTTAPELPATTLAGECYYEMFQYCTSLTTAPELPATAMTYNCYCNMFYNCTSLTSAPELPATTLANGCYGYMFYGCTNLNYVKCLSMDMSGINSYYWLSNVSASGTFVKNPNLNSWVSGPDGIPNGWTVQNAN